MPYIDEGVAQVVTVDTTQRVFSTKCRSGTAWSDGGRDTVYYTHAVYSNFSRMGVENPCFISYLRLMKIPKIERLNIETGQFELVESVKEETTWKLIGIFSAEEGILMKVIETEGWMEKKRGVSHIEYD